MTRSGPNGTECRVVYLIVGVSEEDCSNKWRHLSWMIHSRGKLVLRPPVGALYGALF